MINIDKGKVKRILVITLSNIGDIVLTTPVIDVLEKEFPHVRIDVMVGPNGKEIFKNHPRVFKTIVYDKHIPVTEKQRLINKLRKLKYDLIVDLRNTLFPFLVGAKYRTSPIQRGSEKSLLHKKDWHLRKLKQLGMNINNACFSIHTSKSDKDYVDRLINGISDEDNFVAVSPGAKSLIKRWRKDGFIQLCEKLIEELELSLVMIGDHNDNELANEIKDAVGNKVHNFTGKTSINQLAYLLKRSKMLVTNDSAPLHIGSAVGTKVLAVFGPTDPHKYGPQGEGDRVVRKGLHCSPCELAQCRFDHECMKLISPDEVFNVVKEMLKKQ